MRKLAFIGSVVVALLVAGCGGGSGSSSSASSTGGGESAGPTPQQAWAKELTAVMTRFENNVSAHMVEQLSTTFAQSLLEPLYHSYAEGLEKLADQLEATDPPAACAAVDKKIVKDGRALGQLTNQLGNLSQMSEPEFAAFGAEQHAKISRYGRELSELTADPGC